jgi:hypothetical protein
MRTDRQDMSKLTVAFCNFSKASKKEREEEYKTVKKNKQGSKVKCCKKDRHK